MKTITPADAFGLAIIAQETVVAVCQGRNISDQIKKTKMRMPLEAGIVSVIQAIFDDSKTAGDRIYRVKQFFKSAKELKEYYCASSDEKTASAILLWAFGNNEKLYHALEYNLDINKYLKR